MGIPFENVPRLQWLSPIGLTLSQVLELVYISIKKGPKEFRNLAQGSIGGPLSGRSQLNWTLASSSVPNDGSLLI